MASSSSSSRYYHRRYTKEEIARITHCECKYPIYEQVSWTPENPGRRFKACPTRNKDKKCEVYGFLDDELPSQYYKDLMFKLHKDNESLEFNLHCLTHQLDGQQPNEGLKVNANGDLKVYANEGQKVFGTEDVSIPLIYKDLNELKIKGKLYDMLFFGSTCIIILLLVLIVAVIVGLFTR